jgi:hypothetical protein
MADFGISRVEPSGSATREWVKYATNLLDEVFKIILLFRN